MFTCCKIALHAGFSSINALVPVFCCKVGPLLIVRNNIGVSAYCCMGHNAQRSRNTDNQATSCLKKAGYQRSDLTAHPGLQAGVMLPGEFQGISSGVLQRRFCHVELLCLMHQFWLLLRTNVVKQQHYTRTPDKAFSMPRLSTASIARMPSSIVPSISFFSELEKGCTVQSCVSM